MNNIRWLCIGLVIALSACQSSKKPANHEYATKTDPLKVADPDSDSILDPPQSPDKTPPPIPAEEEVEITPDTELYFDAISYESRKTKVFEGHEDPHCVYILKHREEQPFGQQFTYAEVFYEQKRLAGDAVVLARIKSFQEHDYCENGVLSKYNYPHDVVSIEVLHSLLGPIPKGPSEILTQGHPGYGEGSTQLIVLQKTEYNDYAQVANIPFLFYKKERPPIESGHFSLPWNHFCLYTNLPRKVSDLNEYFKEVEENREAYIKKPIDELSDKTFEEWVQKIMGLLKQTHGTPGAPCDIQKDLEEAQRKLEEEERLQALEDAKDEFISKERKRIIYGEPFGKKVPCPDPNNCPGGYLIEDMEVYDFLEELYRREQLADEWEKAYEASQQ